MFLTAFLQGRGRPAESGPLDGAHRRSIYQEVRRNFVPPWLTVWDFPPPSATRGSWTVSNVPAQALALANDPFVLGRAEAFGGRARAHAGTEANRITWMYVTTLGRRPTEAELAACIRFLGASGDEAAGYADLAQTLFTLQESVWIP